MKGQFDQHFVAHQHADAVLAHLSGGVAKNLVIVFETYAEHRVGQQFDHRAAHFQEFFFRHRRGTILCERNGANELRDNTLRVAPITGKRPKGKPAARQNDTISALPIGRAFRKRTTGCTGQWARSGQDDFRIMIPRYGLSRAAVLAPLLAAGGLPGVAGAQVQRVPPAPAPIAASSAPQPPTAPAEEVSVNGEPIEQADARGLDRQGDILVVAHRIKGQVEADQPPIITLDEEDIASYGVSSLQQLVAALAPQTGSGRGRGDGAPVFLMNGMRVSNFHEIRGLPPEAIRRVEVLPEEVALKFGFRPDQRVVNFILKDSFHSVLDELQHSAPTRGGYSAWHDEATLVRIDKGARLNVTGSYDVQSPETEAARAIIQQAPPAPGLPNSATPNSAAPDPAAHRTLLPGTSSASLNGTMARPLGIGAGVTINALIQRDSSDALNGLRATDTDLALLTATRTTTASIGLGLNLPVHGWLLSATLDGSHVQASSTIDLATAALPEMAGTTSDSATTLATVAGTPRHLPAGDVALTVKTGLAFSQIASAESRDGIDTRLRRGDAQIGFSLDLPLTSRKNHVAGALGDLSLNMNGEVHHVSDFGGLVDLGLGLTWKPTTRLTLVATTIGTEVAPTLSNLAAPATLTPGVAVFDFVRGQTVLATVLTGGNPLLARERQHDLKLAVYWTLPFGGGNDNLVVEYFRNHADDPVNPFPLLSGAVQTAFADRITRGSAGQIVAIDERPITLGATRSARLRTTLNLGGAFGKPDPALAGRRGGAGSGGGGGFGGRGPGGFGGGPGAGLRGAGPGSGAAPGRGPGGFGGPPPGDGRGRWNISVSYSYELVNTAQLSPGGAVFDQLRGDALTGTGVARHTANLDGGAFYRGLGLRVNGSFAGPTHISASGVPGSLPLDFGSLATLNLRLFLDLGRMPGLVKKVPLARGARLELGVTNLFDGQQKVTDSTGATPLRYQAGYLDPAGRVIRVELRKQF
eukprot:gene9090-9170_t